jgi:hypothetical protein
VRKPASAEACQPVKTQQSHPGNLGREIENRVLPLINPE